jgi:hypothetical protein
LSGQSAPDKSDNPHQDGHCDRGRKPKRELVQAKNLEADRRQPIQERRFFEKSNPIDIRSYPVAGFGHVFGGLGIVSLVVIDYTAICSRKKI